MRALLWAPNARVLELQSCFGTKPLKFRVGCSQNGNVGRRALRVEVLGEARRGKLTSAPSCQSWLHVYETIEGAVCRPTIVAEDCEIDSRSLIPLRDRSICLFYCCQSNTFFFSFFFVMVDTISK